MHVGYFSDIFRYWTDPNILAINGNVFPILKERKKIQIIQHVKHAKDEMKI